MPSNSGSSQHDFRDTAEEQNVIIIIHKIIVNIRIGTLSTVKGGELSTACVPLTGCQKSASISY